MAESSRYLHLIERRVGRMDGMDCYTCLQMAERKPDLQQEGLTQTCLLCNNQYCEEHKGKEEGVCGMIGHNTYASNPRHQARHAPVELFSSLEARERKLGATQTVHSEDTFLNGQHSRAGHHDCMLTSQQSLSTPLKLLARSQRVTSHLMSD